MIPADLVRARVKGPAIAPHTVDPAEPVVQHLSATIVTAFQEATAEQARLGDVLAELEEALTPLAPAKLVRGLVRVARNRAEALPPEGLDPKALRMATFMAAAATTGAAPRFSAVTAEEVLCSVGADHALTGDAVRDALFADLPLERRITIFRVPDPDWLVHRYNVALVQALLYSATSVTVTMGEATAPRMRQLFRWIKFHQLLFSAARNASGDLEIRLDGPMSLFGPSTRYGLQLARFLPALLLQPGPWALRAEVSWTRRKLRKTLTITHEDPLRSHYQDTGAYRTKTHTHFLAQWAEKPRAYTLTEDGPPLSTKGWVGVPDFVLTRAGDGVPVHVELVGYWRCETLEVALEATDGAQVLFAVSRRLAAGRSEAVPVHPRIISFAEVLPVAKVLDAADRMGTASQIEPGKKTTDGPI